MINIERGVKQGDALSCALFIIAIYPVIRNLNKNNKIKQVEVRKRNFEVGFKAAAFADDISVICLYAVESIQQVFREYEKLTNRSGLELNAEKTEFLLLNNSESKQITFNYYGKNFCVSSVGSIKICGLVFGIDNYEEYKNNVTEKITKLSYKLKLWSHRHLTFEGKILLTKTFGLSQLIYNMQSYAFNKPDIVWAERVIFGFIWSSGSEKLGKDRIKRSILKNDYKEGGLKVTDVECLDRSLKLRQYVRAATSNHSIAKIQTFTHNLRKNYIKQEFGKITTDEPICQSAQETINMITDYNRSCYEKMTNIEEDYNINKCVIEEVSSINLSTFLERNKKVFHQCILKSLSELNVTYLHELLHEREVARDRNTSKAINIVLSAFPIHLKQIAEKFNENIHEEHDELTPLRTDQSNWKNLAEVSTKHLQLLLKQALNRLDHQNHKLKLGLNNFDDDNFLNFRKKCKNPRLRNVYFRLCHNDFFTRDKMKRYKMVSSDGCIRCGELENTKHMLWSCVQVDRIWKIYNNMLLSINQRNDSLNSFDDIYKTSENAEIVLIKIKVIQSLIQIERPSNWSENNLKKIVKDIVDVEKYNHSVNGKMLMYEQKWSKVVAWLGESE
jgi:hypothetical protein